MVRGINVGTEGHIDWGNPPDEPPEMGYVPRMVVIYPPNPHLQEQLELLNRVMMDSGSPQDFIFVTAEELAMRRTKTVLCMVGMMPVDFSRIMIEVIETGSLMNPIIYRMPCQKDFPYQSHKKHQMRSVLTQNSSSMKLNIPRGIHRDERGRPQKQNLTSSRLSRRNGSRK